MSPENANLLLIIFRMSNLFFRLRTKIVETFLRNMKESKRLIKKTTISLKFYNIEVINCHAAGYKFKIEFQYDIDNVFKTDKLQ